MALVFVVLVMLGAASAGQASDCVSQPATGLCMALIPRYFYNATSGQCERFTYGGCGGNKNNYKTLSECEETCVSLTEEDCSADAEVGLCDAIFHRFYFDAESATCKDFIYGGCGGNKNNFRDEAECSDKCAKYAKKGLSLEECSAEGETGMCRAYFPSYYFNIKTGKCESFVYGGCGGNTNRFADEESCMGQCGKYAIVQPDPEPEVLCAVEPEVGPCRAAIPRFFWNHRLGVCQPFTYGGCEGNTNNFHSADDCHDACQGTPITEPADCESHPETGMCLAYFPSYFYNATSGRCEDFIYGGCGGNGNKFQTPAACYATCGQAIPLVDERLAVGVCGQPMKVGLCKAAMPRFYYDVETSSCKAFIYGGCGGNENNFKTLGECHNTCVA